MKTRILLYISVVCSLVGIASLFLLSLKVTPKPRKVGEIGYDDLGDYVKIQGKVKSKYVTEDDHMFLTVSDESGMIEVIAFANKALSLKRRGVNPKENESIMVTGKVNEYQGRLEIIVEQIR